MTDFRLRMKKSVEILDMKLQEINDATMAIGRKKFGAIQKDIS
ncbi:hypothetical protein ABFY48_22095 [Lysinibacillus pakistanensis]